MNSIVALAAGLTRGFAENGLAIDTMEETELAELSTVDSDTMYVAYGYKGGPGRLRLPQTGARRRRRGLLQSFSSASSSGTPYEHHRRFLEEAVRRGLGERRLESGELQGVSTPLGGPLARTYADGVLLPVTRLAS